MIRYIGGLLSAYDLINSDLVAANTYNKAHVDALLAAAVTNSDKLKSMFNTPSALPFANINFTSGEYSNYLTGDESYRKLAQKAEIVLISPSQDLIPPNLVGSSFDYGTGKYLDFAAGRQAGIDSFYEYLIKISIYSPTEPSTSTYKDFWVGAVDSTIKYLAKHPFSFPGLTFITSLNDSGTPEYTMDAYACFAGSNYLLGGKCLNNQAFIDLGLAVTDSCHQTFNTTAAGLNSIVFSWFNQNNKTYKPSVERDPAQVAYFQRAGYFVDDPFWGALPELIEFIFYAYRITGDTIWQEYAWEIFQAIVHDTKRRQGEAYADLHNVTQARVGKLIIYVPSFFFAEVMKYLYLMFSEPSLMSLDDYAQLYSNSTNSTTNSNFTIAAYDPLSYVDQLIGTSNGGDVFGGATLPFGMAKAVADTTADDNQGGFTTDGYPVSGFSSMHDSGTGGEPSLGNFPLFPYAGCLNDTVDGCTYNKFQRAIPFKNESLVATPGYFALTLQSGVHVAMTVAQHTSLFKFTFPAGNTQSPLILIDLTDLSDSRQDNASISVESDGRISGAGVFLPSFGSGNYTAYFCADFNKPIRDNGIFVNSRASTEVKELMISRGINEYPLPGGGFNRFPVGTETVMARVGLSLISIDKACSNGESEIPNYDFNALHTAAENEWRSRLSNIKVDMAGVDRSFAVNFYSGIYRTMVNPQNYTGENPLWQSTEPYFDSFYCIWDLFRSAMPFLTILDPTAVTQMVRSLIDTYRHSGWLPDCRMSLNKGYTQGGSNADNILADAFVKGLAGGINWHDGYAAVVKDAEVEPYDWSNEGRGGLDSWKALGYVPVQDFDYKGFGTMTRSVSRTLEYAYNDFCISQIAAGLGMEADVVKYQKSSENWKNLFNPQQTSYLINSSVNTGFVGFFEPKYLNKTWGYQDPLMCSNLDTNPNSICSLQDNGAETFESSLWEYGFFVPHDQAKLISTYGGSEAFVKRLNYLHNRNITYIGNEPAFLTVYQYHYAGRPALSARRAHLYIPAYFQPTKAGLPGNDDSGAMGSFLAFSMMGLFPNPGQDVYLIIPPFFKSVSVTDPSTGKTAQIRNINFDASYKNIYIQKATLDGKPYTKNWLDHSFFTEGKTLVLTLGSSESAWGTTPEDLPPSLSSGNSTMMGMMML